MPDRASIGAAQECMPSCLEPGRFPIGERGLCFQVPGCDSMPRRLEPIAPKAYAHKRAGTGPYRVPSRNRQAFCKQLEANGIRFEQPYRNTRHQSFASAQIADPRGTTRIDGRTGQFLTAVQCAFIANAHYNAPVDYGTPKCHSMNIGVRTA